MIELADMPRILAILGLFVLWMGALLGLLLCRHIELCRRVFRLHDWRYRNPFDRTCRVCGRHEVLHGFDAALTHQNGWWEVFADGHRPGPCNRHTEHQEGR